MAYTLRSLMKSLTERTVFAASFRRALSSARLRFMLLATVVTVAAVYGGAKATSSAGPQDTPRAAATTNSSSQSLSTKTEISSQTTSNSNDSNGAKSSDNVSVTVNGQHVAVPTNGELHKEISDDSSHTTLDLSHHASAGNSSLEVELHSTSTSSSGGESSE